MTNHNVKEIALQGIITVDDFDSIGNPVRYVLLTNDENKYIIEQGSKNPDTILPQYNRSTVELTGVIRFDGRQAMIAFNDIKQLSSPKTGNRLNALK